jgi:hypothetical protein
MYEDDHAGESRRVEWDEESEAYRYTDNPAEAEAERVYLERSKTCMNDLKKMEKLAEEIFHKVKRLVAKL